MGNLLFMIEKWVNKNNYINLGYKYFGKICQHTRKELHRRQAASHNKDVQYLHSSQMLQTKVYIQCTLSRICYIPKVKKNFVWI